MMLLAGGNWASEHQHGGQVVPSLILSQLGHGLNSKGRKGGDRDKEGEELYPMFWVPSACVAVWKELDQHTFFVGQARFPPDIIAPKMANSNSREDNEIIIGCTSTVHIILAAIFQWYNGTVSQM